MSSEPSGKSIYSFEVDCSMVCSDGRQLRIRGHGKDLFNAFDRFISGNKSGEIKVEFGKGGVAGIKLTEVVR